MLVIRDAQIAALRRARAEAFERRLEALLRSRLVEWRDAPGPAVRDIAVAACSIAARHGIYRPEDLERFTLYVGRYGSELGETPETACARPILRDRATSGRDKLDALDALDARGALGGLGALAGVAALGRSPIGGR